MIPNQLSLFHLVVKHGNFSSAARQLGISSAAVSKAIAQLEKNLELRLFHRTTHSLTLTECGQLLHRKTSHLVEQLQTQIQITREGQQKPHGKLRVNLPDSFGRLTVLPLLPAFMQKYPNIELEMKFDDRNGDVVKEGADIGIGVMVNPDSGLIARDLYKVQRILVASPQYIAQYGMPNTLEELSQHNCIAYRSETTGRKQSWNLIGGGEQMQIEPHGNLTVNSMSAVVAAAEMGAGIAALGTCSIEHQLEQGILQRVLASYELEPAQMKIYYSSRQYMPTKIRLLIDYLVEHIQDATHQLQQPVRVS